MIMRIIVFDLIVPKIVAAIVLGIPAFVISQAKGDDKLIMNIIAAVILAELKKIFFSIDSFRSL